MLCRQRKRMDKDDVFLIVDRELNPRLIPASSFLKISLTILQSMVFLKV